MTRAPDGSLEAEIAWLYGLQHLGVKLGLDNIHALLDLMDRPERGFRSVLVAGTNGKGSVAAMIQAALASAGISTGLFTSPHLVRPNERIRIGEHDIEDGELARRLGGMRRRIEDGLRRGTLDVHPSFFEVVTATALEAFRDAAIEVAVLEVGLGGRLDATNAVAADLAVIVSVDLDHVQTLGPTIERIAAEKGGIIRDRRPLVSGVVRQRAVSVLARICREREALFVDAPLAARLVAEGDAAFTLRSARREYADLRPSLRGRHQIHNARVAVAALERLEEHAGLAVGPDAVRDGLARVRWPGRLQWVPGTCGGPPLLLDGAHNPAGARTLARYLRERSGAGHPAPVMLLGGMRDKQLAEMVATLAPWVCGAVATRPRVERAARPEEIAAIVQERLGPVEIVSDPVEALERAARLAGPDGAVLVTGSLYLVGEVLAALEGRSSPGPVAL